MGRIDDVVDRLVQKGVELCSAGTLPHLAADKILNPKTQIGALVSLARIGLAKLIANEFSRLRAESEDVARLVAEASRPIEPKPTPQVSRLKEENDRARSLGLSSGNQAYQIHKLIFCPHEIATVYNGILSPGYHDKIECIGKQFGGLIKGRKLWEIKWKVKWGTKSEIDEEISRISAENKPLWETRTARVKEFESMTMEERTKIWHNRCQDIFDECVGKSLLNIVLACGERMKPLLEFTTEDTSKWRKYASNQAAGWERRASWFASAESALLEHDVQNIADLPPIVLGRLSREAGDAWGRTDEERKRAS